MTPRAVSISALPILWVALGYGCTAELEAGDPNPTDVTLSAVSQDQGGISSGCRGFRDACREGNASMCAWYSQHCEVRIGVIGDSLSDEYQGAVSLLPGAQWTEQVQGDARISLGAHEADPSVRGEPRNDGYGLNWARFGQAALGLQWSSPAVKNHPAVIAAGLAADPRLQTIVQFDAQIHGLGAQIANGDVDVALVWVGHNDLFIRTFIGYEQDGGQQAFFAALIGRIVTAAATLRAYASADPELVKAKVAILGLAGTASALNPALSAAAANAGITFIDPFNTAVSAIITEQLTTGSFGVGDVDLMPFTFQFVPQFQAIPRMASPGDLAFPGTGPCGFNPATSGIGCSTPAYAEPFQHYDGIHPNTLYMGVIGNQIITDVNAAFGFAMRTISDETLLTTAGL
jgi:hypothetical protein